MSLSQSILVCMPITIAIYFEIPLWTLNHCRNLDTFLRRILDELLQLDIDMYDNRHDLDENNWSSVLLRFIYVSNDINTIVEMYLIITTYYSRKINVIPRFEKKQRFFSIFFLGLTNICRFWLIKYLDHSFSFLL